MDPITAMNAFKAIEKIPTTLQMTQTEVASRAAENVAVDNLASKMSTVEKGMEQEVARSINLEKQGVENFKSEMEATESLKSKYDTLSDGTKDVSSATNEDKLHEREIGKNVQANDEGHAPRSEQEIQDVKEKSESPESKGDLQDASANGNAGAVENGKEMDLANPADAGERALSQRESREQYFKQLKDLSPCSDTREQYFKQLKDLSPCSDTLEGNESKDMEWSRTSPEEVISKRTEFNEHRPELKKEWCEKYDRPWPQYEKDVYSDNGNLIRRAGNDYDAHHIQPLCLGGENRAENLTPLHVLDHYDRQGIHAVGTPYDMMCR